MSIVDELFDSNGNKVKEGDRVQGEGFITFQGGFKIDRTPIVTVRVNKGIVYFGGLSAKSFNRFWVVDDKGMPMKGLRRNDDPMKY